jgi:hypothetical protein
VGPVDVVVLDVVDDEAFELVPVPDDGAVEKFAAQGIDPAFSEGVRDRGSDRGFEDLEAFGSEDLIERVGELADAISDQCPCAGELAAWRRNRLRAAWVVQASVGLGVTPAKNTSRVVTSMKNSR